MGRPELERDHRRVPVFAVVGMLDMGSTYHRPREGRRGRRGARMLAVGALLLLAALAPAARASTLVITGSGEGHGVGMSQYGALGFAQHGFTDQQILARYYSGTTLGQAPAKAVVKVLVGSKVRKVPLELAGYRLVTLDSGESHSNAASGYNQRREECARDWPGHA